MTFGPIERAQKLIDKGDKDGAVKLLTPIVKGNRDDWEAWLLLAKALTPPERAMYAVDQVLRLQPDHQEARKLKVQLEPSPIDEFPFPEIMPPSRSAPKTRKAPPAPRSSSLPQLPRIIRTGVFGILMLLIIVAVGYGLYSLSVQGQVNTAAGHLTSSINQNSTQPFDILYSGLAGSYDDRTIYCFITTPVEARTRANTFRGATLFMVVYNQAQDSWTVTPQPEYWSSLGCRAETERFSD